MRSVFDYIRKHKSLLLVILPAFFLYMLVIFPSGTYYCFTDACGINFWGVHGHDAIWHLAIANVSFQKFPFMAPTFSGENLYGYNYFLDLIIFLFSKIGIPAIFSYFKLLPVFWFITFTLLLTLFARRIKDSALFILIFLLLNYFAASFSYLLTLLHDGTVSGSSTLLPLPAMHAMSNLPYAYSLLPFLIIMVFLKEGRFNPKNILIIGLCIFLIMGLKFYGGIIAIFMVFFNLVLNYKNIKIKKLVVYLLLIGLFLISSIFLFYDPFRSIKTGSVFGWAPFALIHTITEEPNQFYLRSLTDARYYILAQPKLGPRFFLIELINLIIFLFFYLGTRFFALFYIGFLWLKKKLDRFDVSVIFTILFSISLTATLVQKAEWWNTIQFFFYAIFLITIYLAKLVFDLIQTKKIPLILLSFALIVISIPSTLDLLRLFAAIPGAAYVSKDEIQALNFLKLQPNGIVLTPLYSKTWKGYIKANNLYAYEDTAYVSAFSGKQEYFANILQLRLTSVPYKRRLAKMQNMDCTILSEVNYIYEIRKLKDSEKIAVKCNSKKIKKIFENKEINIYSIIK